MIKFALYIIVIADCIFNTWGDIHSGIWRIFYDLSHYIPLLLISIDQLKKNDTEFYIFIAYFTLIIIQQIVLLITNYSLVYNDTYSYWTFYALLFVLIFITIKTTKLLHEKK